jgi:hypothetical protein
MKVMEDGGDEASIREKTNVLVVHHGVKHNRSPIDKEVGIDAVEKTNEIFRNVVEGVGFGNDVVRQNPGDEARAGFEPSIFDG